MARLGRPGRARQPPFFAFRARQALGDQDAVPPFLLISRDAIQLNPAANVELDVHRFQQELHASRWESAEADGQPASAVHSAVQHLRAATGLYRGPFLEGFSVGDSAAFEEWALIKREELARQARWALHGLTALTCRLGDYAGAERNVRRLLEMDRWDELANRRLMLVLLQEGQRNAALRHYAAYQEELTRELSCEPEDETQALYAQIRDSTLPRPPPHLRVPASPPLPVSASAQPIPRFVAREAEMARLTALLDRALAGCGGVALIAGEAGAGKTTLLDEFARRAGHAHGDLVTLRGSCNANGGAGDPYLPFREILQALAGDMDGRRAGGTLSPEQARRAWEALPAVGAALAVHGPDLLDTFVPGEALLRRVETFPALSLTKGPGPPGAEVWQARLREIVRGGRAREDAAPQVATGPGAPGTGLGSSPPRKRGSSESSGEWIPTFEGMTGLVPAASQPDLFAQVTQVLYTVSLGRPLLLAVDDLQWADGGTVALLFHLGRRLAGSRVLLACAYRPEALQDATDSKGMPLEAVLQELTREWGDVLVDLDRADGRAFVETYVDSEPNRLGTGFRQALYDHTEGNPLFAVELLRSFERGGALVQDEGGRWVEAAGLDWERWPPLVEAIIAGHLAGLPEEDRALLGAASVQGEQFVAEVAARVLGRDEEAAVRRLSGPLSRPHRLVQADRLERLAWSGQRVSHYRFRHLLVQRSAYGSLDMVERARLHEATGRALEAIYAPLPGAEGERPVGLAAELARHYEAAGMPLQAARALHDAGRLAMRLAAFRQALDLFDHGLALLAHEPPSPQRKEIERLLEVARLGPQRNLAGSGSATMEGALARAAEAGAGDAPGRPNLATLSARVALLSARGQFEEGLALVEQVLDQATLWGEQSFVSVAHFHLGFIYHFRGNPQEAETHFDWIFAWLTPERQADVRGSLGYDVRGYALAFSALDQWFLGYPEKALARSSQAVAGALEQGDLYGQALASGIGLTSLFLLRADAAALQERAEQCHRLCREHGVGVWQVYAEAFLGWLAVLRGEDVAGIEQMRSAIAGWQAKGWAVGTDALVLVLADGCLLAASRRPPGGGERAGLLTAALAAIEPLLGPAAPCGQIHQAELHRVRGELLLVRDGPAASEPALECFQKALRLAGEHGLRCPELRAAMGLVRLRQRQGDVCTAELAEARESLHAVYARFTEGFDTADLIEAKALLDEVG